MEGSPADAQRAMSQQPSPANATHYRYGNDHTIKSEYVSPLELLEPRRLLSAHEASLLEVDAGAERLGAVRRGAAVRAPRVVIGLLGRRRRGVGPPRLGAVGVLGGQHELLARVYRLGLSRLPVPRHVKYFSRATRRARPPKIN